MKLKCRNTVTLSGSVISRQRQPLMRNLLTLFTLGFFSILAYMY